jgi:hypothetical protein
MKASTAVAILPSEIKTAVTQRKLFVIPGVGQGGKKNPRWTGKLQGN